MQIWELRESNGRHKSIWVAINKWRLESKETIPTNQSTKVQIPKKRITIQKERDIKEETKQERPWQPPETAIISGHFQVPS
jgi:hypothetical protein